MPIFHFSYVRDFFIRNTRKLERNQYIYQAKRRFLSTSDIGIHYAPRDNKEETNKNYKSMTENFELRSPARIYAHSAGFFFGRFFFIIILIYVVKFRPLESEQAVEKIDQRHTHTHSLSLSNK